MPGGIEDEVVEKRMRRYQRQAEILRQIHSDKAVRAQWASWGYAALTILVAAVLTLLGFAGPERIAQTFFPEMKDPATLQAVLNWSVLAIVILALLGLLFRFDERSAQHYRSVERLTEFIRDVEDRVELAVAEGSNLTAEDLAIVRERYKGIAFALPPSTDREYGRSKRRYVRKRKDSSESARTLDTMDASGWTWSAVGPYTVEGDLGDRLAVLLWSSSQRYAIEEVRDRLGWKFWIVGGAIRDPVWDAISGYAMPTPIDDVDVAFFDPGCPETDDDALSRLLIGAAPNQIWSVVNESHAHVRNSEDPYSSLDDAVARFPESATAVAVQLRGNDLRILAPYGLTDLFDGVLRPSLHGSKPRFDERAAKKAWGKKWPSLSTPKPEDERESR